MGRREKHKSVNPNEHLFVTSDNYQIPDSNRVIEGGEVIKISGEHGTKFKFKAHVTKIDSGIEWIDCYELERGVPSKHRSFNPDRIRAMPKNKNRI